MTHKSNYQLYVLYNPRICWEVSCSFTTFWWRKSHFCSIGSLGTRGETDIVEDVHVENCTLTETLTGVRIKTWQVIVHIKTMLITKRYFGYMQELVSLNIIDLYSTFCIRVGLDLLGGSPLKRLSLFEPITPLSLTSFIALIDRTAKTR